MNNINRNIIFIGGIHGVGKGTMCDFISKRIDVIHISASDVLKWEEISLKENKLVENLNSTQIRLINGLNNLIKDDTLHLLDGHFCLLNSAGEPERIPELTFEMISPKKLIVIVEDVAKVVERLNKRDKVKYNLSILEKMQSMEIEYAKYLSKKFSIPFQETTNKDIDSIIKFIEK